MTEILANSWTKDIKRMLPGILISLVALGAVLYFTDLEEVGVAITEYNYWHIPAAAAVFVLSVLARAVAWRGILQEKVSYGKTFLTLNEGYLLNNILPFRLGEVGRAFLLSNTSKISFWEVLSTIMVERIIDLAMAAGLLLGTLPYVFELDWARRSAFVVSFIVVLGFAILFIISRNQVRVLTLLEKFGGRWPKLISFGQEKLESFFAGLASLQDVRRFSRVMIWMVISWILNIGYFYVVLRGFPFESQFLWAVFTVALLSIGVAIPSSPAYVGVYHATVILALKEFDVVYADALAYAVITHGLYVTITVFIGIFALVRDGQSLGHIYQQIRGVSKSG